MTSKDIIAPIPVEILEKELNQERWVRTTRKGDNEIYIVNNQNAPNVVKEIGRLREVTFRAAGGGTGLSLDLDEFDTNENSYQQLIVWSKEDKEIIGGYRFIECKNAIREEGEPELSTAHYFDFSEDFIENYLPDTIELGRSWVQPNFQPSVNPRKGLFALDNIWDGLGALTVTNPNIKYFFGKVTMYPDYDKECRDFLLHFMHHYFPDKENLLSPKHPLQTEGNDAEYAALLKDLDFKDGFKVLNQYIRSRGENVPPLVNIYMHLSPTMKTFGTAVNPDFGGVEETGILVTIADIFEEKKTRHIDPML
ncbi:Acetyltransferase (GNAT) domain-containing protein [Lishizhenia tianjinensis]|uniref:Acetyltransferase (GNAT) domain-containing protein n=1 Tax=Lishizhenia tianjinensis TaxID=477690 RepID=A0A1I7BUZ1_9FLAO|nr:GNAT family N-acetyltransferase [Lishizhenia tianjinensis]SFT90973.1 Acetyltransferase (GNAT) domain-containing protein [Lishizhenia tianjinensis]